MPIYFDNGPIVNFIPWTKAKLSSTPIHIFYHPKLFFNGFKDNNDVITGEDPYSRHHISKEYICVKFRLNNIFQKDEGTNQGNFDVMYGPEWLIDLTPLNYQSKVNNFFDDFDNPKNQIFCLSKESYDKMHNFIISKLETNEQILWERLYFIRYVETGTNQMRVFFLIDAVIGNNFLSIQLKKKIINDLKKDSTNKPVDSDGNSYVFTVSCGSGIPPQ